MFFRWLAFYFPLFFLVSPYTYAEKITINVGISPHQQVHRQLNFLTRGNSCDAIESDALKQASRVLIESILICQALRIGGLEPHFNFKSVSNIPRLIQQVSAGDIDLMIDSIWLALTDTNTMYVSDPILREGEIVKGIYSSKKNKAIFKVTSLKELQAYNAVSSSFWKTDWQTLKLMGITSHSVSKYAFMLRMVDAQRADFLLDDFSNREDLRQVYQNIALHPIPNVKIAIKGTRHIVINKHNSNSLKIYNALQKGLKAMRKQGTISQAFQEAGFINAKVKDWQVLCCQ